MICGGGLNRSLKISATYEMMAFWKVCPHKLLQTSSNMSRHALELPVHVQGLMTFNDANGKICIF